MGSKRRHVRSNRRHGEVLRLCCSMQEGAARMAPVAKSVNISNAEFDDQPSNIEKPCSACMVAIAHLPAIRFSAQDSLSRKLKTISIFIVLVETFGLL